MDITDPKSRTDRRSLVHRSLNEVHSLEEAQKYLNTPSLHDGLQNCTTYRNDEIACKAHYHCSPNYKSKGRKPNWSRTKYDSHDKYNYYPYSHCKNIVRQGNPITSQSILDAQQIMAKNRLSQSGTRGEALHVSHAATVLAQRFRDRHRTSSPLQQTATHTVDIEDINAWNVTIDEVRERIIRYPVDEIPQRYVDWHKSKQDHTLPVVLDPEDKTDRGRTKSGKLRERRYSPCKKALRNGSCPTMCDVVYRKGKPHHCTL